MRPQPWGTGGRAEPAPPAQGCRGGDRPLRPVPRGKEGHGCRVGVGSRPGKWRSWGQACLSAWVCLGVLWVVLVAVRLGAGAAQAPRPAPLKWGLEGLGHVGPDAEWAAQPGTRGRETLRCVLRAPCLAPPTSGGGRPPAGAAGSCPEPVVRQKEKGAGCFPPRKGGEDRPWKVSTSQF
ncbi:hypothetical protein HJG60_011819 [Phyllostomus discolor]|uniref:Uncharacterized protein n=1 Tax=Phyllostomus discolor TaxID=89673 RepID=A0A834DYC9_9CHIR|nr:hypothetical protein HJG60_011819 [Phyllostomus discolor]